MTNTNRGIINNISNLTYEWVPRSDSSLIYFYAPNGDIYEIVTCGIRTYDFDRIGDDLIYYNSRGEGIVIGVFDDNY